MTSTPSPRSGTWRLKGVRYLFSALVYCHVKVAFGKVEAINGKIRAMLRRGRGYRDHEYLLLKIQKATAKRRAVRRAA